MPPLSNRTVSMPVLNDGGPFRNLPGQALPPGRDHLPHKPMSRRETPLGSQENLFIPPGQWRTARLRNSPQPEPAHVSALASVRNGWLPVPKRAVLCDITSHAPPLTDSTCQEQYNPSNATSIQNCFVKKNVVEHTVTDGKERDTSTQAKCMDPRTRGLSGQASPNVMQNSDLASLESDSPLGWEKWRKGWEERRTAFLSEGVQPGERNALSQRRSPSHGTASTPASSRTASPPAGLETLPSKPRFSSIMASARRIPRSPMSPSSSGGTTESDEAESSASPVHKTPPANHPSVPVVRRRASAIVVTDTGRSRRSDETSPGVRPREFRHSYTGGDRKENIPSRFVLQSGTDSAQPSARMEERTGSDNAAQLPRRPRSCSLAEPDGSVERRYRSTLSLYLCRPSSIGEEAGDSGRPARPLSFAGAFRHTVPSLGGPPDPTPKRPSFGSPEEANVSGVRDSACSVNMHPNSVNYPSAGVNAESSEQVVGTGQGPVLHPAQNWSQRSDAVKPQAVSTTLNPKDHKIDVGLKDLSSFDTHQSAEAILALNAASIINSIKLQTRINKMADLFSKQESKNPREPGNETVKNCGSHESSPPTGEVLRRDHGNAGRKARPHPIYWQEPPSDQQEAHAPAPLTLREALELLRPNFIRRSQRRVKEVEQRAQKRRAQQGGPPELPSAQATGKTCRTKPLPHSDDHCKPGDRAIAGKETLRRKSSKSNTPDLKRNKQEEKKKLVSQTNRLRATAFKKKLLEQILRRNKD